MKASDFEKNVLYWVELKTGDLYLIYMNELGVLTKYNEPGSVVLPEIIKRITAKTSK